jgi:exopolysaccharide biosynthesis predicted pyruvyltransferase EpsI
MHELYRQQMFEEAIAQCKLIRRNFDGRMEGYYDMWIKRCNYMKTQPLPKDWDGIFVAQSK